MKNEECMKSKTAVHTDGGNTCTEKRKTEKRRWIWKKLGWNILSFYLKSFSSMRKGKIFFHVLWKRGGGGGKSGHPHVRDIAYRNIETSKSNGFYRVKLLFPWVGRQRIWRGPSETYTPPHNEPRNIWAGNE